MYSPYLSDVISTKLRSQTVAAIRDVIPKDIEFTHIAVRGLSGMLVATELASLMGKEVMIVRKRMTKHCFFRVEFFGILEGYIIVDDLIETGSTIKKIQKYISEGKKEKIYNLNHAELKAVVCYNENDGDNPEKICGVPVFTV